MQSSSWVSCNGIIHMNAGYRRHYLDAFTVRLLLLTVYPWRDIRGTKMPTALWSARGCKAVRPSQTICPAFYLTHNFFFAFCVWTLPADISSSARTNHGFSCSGDGVHSGCPYCFRPLERHTIGGIRICIPQHESQFLSFLSLHRLLIGEGAPRRATTWVTPQRAMAVES